MSNDFFSCTVPLNSDDGSAVVEVVCGDHEPDHDHDSVVKDVV